MLTVLVWAAQRPSRLHNLISTLEDAGHPDNAFGGLDETCKVRPRMFLFHTAGIYVDRRNKRVRLLLLALNLLISPDRRDEPGRFVGQRILHARLCAQNIYTVLLALAIAELSTYVLRNIYTAEHRCTTPVYAAPRFCLLFLSRVAAGLRR